MVCAYYRGRGRAQVGGGGVLKVVCVYYGDRNRACGEVLKVVCEYYSGRT